MNFKFKIRDRPSFLELAVSALLSIIKYEGWNFNSGNYLFTTDTK